MLEKILYFLKSIWLFFEKYGITIIAVCTALMTISYIIISISFILKKRKENKNIPYAKILEEAFHEMNKIEEQSDKDSSVSSNDVPF